MKRVLQTAGALLVLSLAAGCGGPSRGSRARAAQLASWLDGQSYSVWSTFRRTGDGVEAPASPDGLTLGSPNVFAAVGCNEEDLSSLDTLWSDRRTLRALTRPLTTALRAGSGEVVPLADFPEQTLRRVRHTAVAVGESIARDVRVTCIDFATVDPAQNFLVRWFVVENTGDGARPCHLIFDTLVPGEWNRLNARAVQGGDRLAFVSDVKLRLSDGKLEARLGRLRPGERAAAALLVVGAATPERLQAGIASAESALPRLGDLLRQTCADWEAWWARTPLTTGDERTDDLLDSLLCLLRSHVGPEAVHTGSLKYPHDRAWIRDSYWVQRALLEVGRREEALLNLEFFRRAWRQSGIASYYEIPSLASTAYGYHGVELPHYLVLMVRDAERLAGAPGGACWEMVKGCLDEAAVPPTGLQPMNGDETWLLAAPVRELDDLLDNSWLLIASAEYGAELAGRVGDAEREAHYRTIASQARGALRRFLPRLGEAEWYGLGVGGEGSLDCSLSPGVLARGAVLGALPASDPYLSAGLITSWHRLAFDRGIRAHSRSATISGGTPGHVLYAAADSPSCDFAAELARRVREFCSATGCVWEFHDLYDPAWGGEKRRLWDSAALLMGLVHALFDVRHTDAGVQFRSKPSLPEASPAPKPPFEAQALLARSGPALILQERSKQHAERLSRDLLRQKNRPFPVAAYTGKLPDGDSAVIVSRRNPPGAWARTPRGYWVRQWEGPPQVWVRNTGHVYLDTDPLLTDLLSLLSPERERPLPFPDANFDLTSRFAEAPSGQAVVSAASRSRTAESHLDLAGGKVALEVGGVGLTVSARSKAEHRTLELTVGAMAARADAAELTVTLPDGWWLLYARDMSGKWDRVRDPVRQIRLPDGRIRLTYRFRPGDAPSYLTFELARLEVRSL